MNNTASCHHCCHGECACLYCLFYMLTILWLARLIVVLVTPGLNWSPWLLAASHIRKYAASIFLNDSVDCTILACKLVIDAGAPVIVHLNYQGAGCMFVGVWYTDVVDAFGFWDCWDVRHRPIYRVYKFITHVGRHRWVFCLGGIVESSRLRWDFSCSNRSVIGQLQ